MWLLIAALPSVFGQSPVKWSFASKKIDNKTYELRLTAEVSGSWHLYSQFTPPGGPVPTQISFNSNPMVTIDGEAKEDGNLQERFEEVFGIKVKFFNEKVSFIQQVKLKNNIKTAVTGKLEFMVCNDRECLPPTTVPFSIALTK